jgi:hypothetical protein
VINSPSSLEVSIFAIDDFPTPVGPVIIITFGSLLSNLVFIVLIYNLNLIIEMNESKEECEGSFEIHFKEKKILEEDDVAQIKAIFEAFDIGNRDRVKIEELPDVLRLL